MGRSPRHDAIHCHRIAQRLPGARPLRPGADRRGRSPRRPGSVVGLDHRPAGRRNDARAGGVLGGGARVVRGRLGARLQHRRRFPAEHRDPSRRRYRGRAAHHQECRHPVPRVVYTRCSHDCVSLVLQRHRLGPFTVPVSGDAPPQRLLQAAANDNEPSLSPDGRLLAYSSDESGRREVYVSRFPEMSGRIAISSGGGGRPMWRRDGRELYFLAPDNRVMAVTMTPSSASPPILLFQPALFSSLYPPAPDGSRFLIATRCRQRMWCRWNWC